MPRLFHIAARVLLFFLAATAAAFAGDYLVLRLRSNQTSVLMVRPYFAVPQKNGRTEFMFQDPHQQSCVNSLFAHFGQLPCWYLRRHTEQRINL